MTPWITRRDPSDVAAEAALVDPALPLAGLRLAVKDNIDVAGMPATAGCPAYAFGPEVSAAVVTRLEAAGAVVAGKTALDQFATGLVGTRSPHGALESPLAPGSVSGGSSSGSAVAVATGEADIALGTDTAGSGRVPAAFCGIVGLKPTKGWLPTTGVVPACRSFDCVSVFARDVATAALAVEAAGGPCPSSAASPVRRLGVPGTAVVERWCDGETLAAWTALDLAGYGYEVVEVDLDAYLAAGDLLYGGALVAERHAAVGAFVDAHPDEVDPVVGPLITAAGKLTASAYLRDVERLAELSHAAATVWSEVDAVVMPTTPSHPTIAEVAADPIGANAALGRFTNGCNLVDWCAAAVPAGTKPDGRPFGVTVFGPAGSDRAVWAVGAVIAGQPAPATSDDRPSDEVLLAVCGAHLEGQPLNHQLTDRRARLVARTATAPDYRMVALPTDPPKPGMFRVASGGAPLEVEVWALGAAGFGSFVAEVPAPLAIGSVVLADGTTVSGFTCEPVAIDGAPDITAHGGWRAYLAR
ncbi:MAG TPA: allophanate hydrolase [Iamia sp.]|nr:allophanate hydrolase [Iamia sp.]